MYRPVVAADIKMDARWQQSLGVCHQTTVLLFQVRTDLHFDGMNQLEGQITKEYILEDMLKLVFPTCSEDSTLSGRDAAKTTVGKCYVEKMAGKLCLGCKCLTENKLKYSKML